MTFNLSPVLEAALAPVWEALPLEQAMASLVVSRPGEAAAVIVAEKVLKTPALVGRPSLAAGLWLYVDQLDRSHTVSQAIDDATGAFWHGIMHRREGDFSNSHYWFRRVGKHPAIARVGGGYEPHAFIDAVERAHGRGEAPADLVELQRREWAALFEWCAEEGIRGS